MSQIDEKDSYIESLKKENESLQRKMHKINKLNAGWSKEPRNSKKEELQKSRMIVLEL